MRAAQIDLFVLYLPKDLKTRQDDKTKSGSLEQVCNAIRASKKDIIVIGDKNYRNSFAESHSILGECEWVDRPVDMNELAKAVEKTLAGDEQPKVKKQILIVDDDPSYASMVRAWIKDFYKVDILTAGKQTFAFLNKKKVDLILLDYEMPGMNGSQVFQVLRMDPSTKEIPVVFLTGINTTEEVKNVLELKPNGYILKSAAREQLLEYLAETLK